MADTGIGVIAEILSGLGGQRMASNSDVMALDGSENLKWIAKAAMNYILPYMAIVA